MVLLKTGLSFFFKLKTSSREYSSCRRRRKEEEKKEEEKGYATEDFQRNVLEAFLALLTGYMTAWTSDWRINLRAAEGRKESIAAQC
ncbi:hypothetical protein CEXT_287661 [Caerostris extrusa]|uniref:Uncharacterized protein n=1 Tax=Caerostris extrusa TaxID=172846 RepID=A0AAV4N978_CAEEX|nr:hypothetical protein CEXT_287661 [Caerostris extrusa]